MELTPSSRRIGPRSWLKRVRPRTLIRAMVPLGALATVLMLVTLWQGDYLRIINPARYTAVLSQASFARESGPPVLIALSDGALQTPTVVGGLDPAVLIGAAETGAGTLALVRTSPTASELVRVLADGSSETLTPTTTRRIDPSFDLASGVTAYTVPIATSTPAGPGTTTAVAVWSPATGEQVLGFGSRATVLPGGFVVVYRTEGRIVATQLDTGETFTLANELAPFLFAVDTESMRLALFDPVTQSIQLFSIENQLRASAIGSERIGGTPLALSFARGVPLALVRLSDGSFRFAGAGWVYRVPSSLADAFTPGTRITLSL